MPAHGAVMMMLAHAYAVAEARSCLAALADASTTFDVTVAYEHALLYLDSVHGDDVPALDDPGEGDRQRLLDRAEVAIEALTSYGVDALRVELLLAMLADARDLEVACPDSASGR